MTGSVRKGIYRELDHPADLRVEIYGRCEEELFHNAVRTLYSLLGFTGNMDPGHGGKQTLSFQGWDRPDLLVQLMGECLYTAVVENKCFSPMRWTFRELGEDRGVNLSLEGTWQSPDLSNLERKYDIKAVTHHDARVERGPDGWVATVVMDL